MTLGGEYGNIRSLIFRPMTISLRSNYLALVCLTFDVCNFFCLYAEDFVICNISLAFGTESKDYTLTKPGGFF